jgi:hypothetical protein
MDEISSTYEYLLHIISQISILEQFYNQGIKQYQINGLGTKISGSKLSYIETMMHVRSFLKILNEEPLTFAQQELVSQIDIEYNLIQSLMTRENRLQIESVVKSYIDWFREFIQTLEDNVYSSLVLERITCRVYMLEKFYSEACVICSNKQIMDTKILGETQTYSQIMDDIDSFLKILSGREYSGCKLISIMDFDAVVEPYIVWVYTVLNQSR